MSDVISAAIHELATVHKEDELSPKDRVINWRRILTGLYEAGVADGRSAEMHDSFVADYRLKEGSTS